MCPPSDERPGWHHATTRRPGATPRARRRTWEACGAHRAGAHGLAVSAAARCVAYWDEVAVLVHQTVAITIVSKWGEFTRIVRVKRSLVVVARRGLKTASTRFEFTRSVVVGRFRIEVARLRVCAAAHWLLARTVVVGGQWVVVQGCGRSASRNLVAVAHVISIGILQAIAFTVSSFLWEDTCAVVHLSFWIVIARLQNRAARRETRHEVARPVVLVGILVEVACLWARAAQNGVAASIVHGGCCIVVVRELVGASCTARVLARTVVHFCSRVVVAGIGQGATRNQATQEVT